MSYGFQVARQQRPAAAPHWQRDTRREVRTLPTV